MVAILTTSIETVTATLDERCVLEDRTAAYCNHTFRGQVSGSALRTTYTTVITKDMYTEYPVTMTGFASNFTNFATGRKDQVGREKTGW